MRKFIQNWLFGRLKSDQQTYPDDDGSTSQLGSSTDLEKGPPRSSIGSGDPGSAPEPKAASTRRKMTSSVIQSTVVDDADSAIPSVTLLVLKQDTADRISKVMDKFDSLNLDSPEPKRKNN